MKRDAGEFEVEYSFRRALIRILSLFLIVILCYGGYQFYFSKGEKTPPPTIEEFEEAREKEETVLENSRGNIYSLRKGVQVEGNAQIINNEGVKTLRVKQFKITNIFQN